MPSIVQKRLSSIDFNMILKAVSLAFFMAACIHCEAASFSVKSYTPFFCILILMLLNHLPQLSNSVNITHFVQTQLSHSFTEAIVVNGVCVG